MAKNIAKARLLVCFPFYNQTRGKELVYLIINYLKRNKLNMIVHCKSNHLLNLLIPNVDCWKELSKYYKKKENLQLLMKLNADYKYSTMY